MNMQCLRIATGELCIVYRGLRIFIHDGGFPIGTGSSNIAFSGLPAPLNSMSKLNLVQIHALLNRIHAGCRSIVDVIGFYIPALWLMQTQVTLIPDEDTQFHPVDPSNMGNYQSIFVSATSWKPLGRCFGELSQQPIRSTR
ncbi:hypothetical protein H106_01738 [Trichophyton rubrum CBS 735.88]|nr:hypothetical protein H106_01738 [Trichophyton rubrum CBS 735.88]